MMWHDRTHNNPLHRWLREVICEVCATRSNPGLAIPARLDRQG
jgi:hypothetical protein